MSWYREKVKDLKVLYLSNDNTDQINIRLLTSLTGKDRMILTEGLNRLPGVNSVNVNLHSRQVAVSYDRGMVNLGQIVHTIAKLGYRYVQRG